MHRSRQQSLVAKWLGIGVTVRVRVRVRVRARARAKEWDYFFSLCKVAKTFVLLS